jgi:hypothetical protein
MRKPLVVLALALFAGTARAADNEKVVSIKRQGALAQLVRASAEEDYWTAFAESSCNLNIATLCENGRRGQIEAQSWVRDVTDSLKPTQCESYWVMYMAYWKAADRMVAQVDKHPSDGNEVIASLNSVLLSLVTQYRGEIAETVNSAAKKAGCTVERAPAKAP